MGAVQRDTEGLRTFNEHTTPNEDEVNFQIDEAVTVVQSDVGTEFCDGVGAEGFPAKATSLTALYTAMSIELGYYPEQIERGQSPYPLLKQLYDQRRDQLRSEVEEICGEVPGEDGAEDGTAVGSQEPVYNFDVTTRPLGRSSSGDRREAPLERLGRGGHRPRAAPVSRSGRCPT